MLTLTLCTASALSAQLDDGQLHKMALNSEGRGRTYCLHSSDCGPDQYCANFWNLLPSLIKQKVWDCHGEADCVNDDGTFNKGGACCTSDADCKRDSYCMDFQAPQTKAYICKDKCRDKVCEEQLLHEINQSVKNMTEADAETAMKMAHEAAELTNDSKGTTYCLKHSDCKKNQYCRNFWNAAPWLFKKNVWDCHGEKNCVDEDGNLAKGGACCRSDNDCSADSYCMDYQAPQTKAYKCADKCVGKLCEEELLKSVNEDVQKLTMVNAGIEGKRRNRICQGDFQCAPGYYCNTRGKRPIAVYDCHGSGNCVDKFGFLEDTSACCTTDKHCGINSYCMNYKEPQAEVYFCKRQCGEGQECDEKNS